MIELSFRSILWIKWDYLLCSLKLLGQILLMPGQESKPCTMPHRSADLSPLEMEDQSGLSGVRFFFFFFDKC